MRRYWLALLLLAAAVWSVPGRADEHYEYVVRGGDTLYDLAEKYFVDPSDAATVQRLNRIANPRRLQIGKKLIIPREHLKSDILSAKVVAFRGTVTRQVGTGRGTGIAVGDTVREGAIIETGVNAFVTLAIAGNVKSTIPSRSRLRVVALRRYAIDGFVDRTFQVLQGRSEWDAGQMRRDGGRLQIYTPTATSAVRGTQFRVALDSGERNALITVTDGTVDVVPNDAEGEPADGAPVLRLEQGFGVVATEAGVSAAIALLDKPQLDGPSEVQTEATLQFSAQPVIGAKSYSFRIGADAGLIDVIAEEISPDPHVGFPGLPDGSYYVRLSAIDDNGLEGYARTYGFRRVLATAGGMTAVRRNDTTNFAWMDGGTPTPTRFIISRHPDLSEPLIDRVGLTTSSFAVTGLKRGTYYWAVEKTLFEDGKAIPVRTVPSELVVTAGK